MVALVTLDKAKRALRYDDTDSDDIIQDAINDASKAILEYCDDGYFVDTSGDVPADTAGDAVGIPSDVQRACIYLAGMYLRDPSGFDQKDFADGFMPPALRSLLNPYRTPVVG